MIGGVISSPCWLEKIHVQEVNNFNSKCLDEFSAEYYVSTGKL